LINKNEVNEIAYRKGQKITGIKTKKDLKKKLDDIRKTRLAYPGGKSGAYTITVGAAKTKRVTKKKKPVRKKKPAKKKRKPCKRNSRKKKK
jgi:hypothetical protein